MRSDCSFVRAASGVRFAYIEQGEREGPVVLLLHGYTDSHRSFDLLRPHLPESWRVIALTQRGHGRTDKPDTGYDIASMAADVPAFLDAIGVEQAILVGHSMGAAVALQAAADHPGHVMGAVVIGAFAGFSGNPGVDELHGEVSAFTDAVDPEFVLAFQESTFAEPIPQRFLDTVVGESLRCPAHVWRAVLAGLMAADPLAAARRCLAPVLLIRGDQDAFVPAADQLSLRNALPSARLVTMKGVGHAPHWEQPDNTAVLLRAFAGEVADTGAILRHAVFG